jgi:SH3-like domain-containing protein
MYKKAVLIAFTVLLSTLALTATAQEEKQALPIPRFVILGADEVNVRTGPGTRYPIRLVYRKEGLPVEVIREFDIWRQIRDVDGDDGWVHKSMLSGRRAVIIRQQVQSLLKKPEEGAAPIVRLEPGVIAGVKACEEDWCRLEIASYKGWVKKEQVWGVYPREVFEE